MRALLLGLVLFGAIGLIAELFLMEHYDSWTQAIPFLVLVCGLAFLAQLAIGFVLSLMGLGMVATAAG